MPSLEFHNSLLRINRVPNYFFIPYSGILCEDLILRIITSSILNFVEIFCKNFLLIFRKFQLPHGVSMSTLKYYTIWCGGSLPNPNGPLSTRIYSAAISSANDEVRSVLTRAANGGFS